MQLITVAALCRGVVIADERTLKFVTVYSKQTNSKQWHLRRFHKLTLSWDTFRAVFTKPISIEPKVSGIEETLAEILDTETLQKFYVHRTLEKVHTTIVPTKQMLVIIMSATEAFDESS